MELHVAQVVVIRNNVVEESKVFVGTDRSEVCQRAEDALMEKCAEVIPDWNEYTVDDRDAVLENGYATFDKGSVCLSWPEVNEIE